jgi:peptide/nickel transport system ATP-binding protein
MSDDLERPVIEVNGLCTAIGDPGVPMVRDVSFAVRRGRVLGLVGESGSGKSMTATAIMGLLDPPARITAGEIRLLGESLVARPEETMRTLRGNRMAMVFQDPMMTLNPVLPIGAQVAESVRAHRPVSRSEAWEIGSAALSRVGIAAPAERMRAYPHQFSGGMRQRVAIAIALINDPALIVADEPTTALDVTVQGQILAEFQSLAAQSGTAVIWISHDLSVISGLADEIAVMYAGTIVESGPTASVLRAPHHPYTIGLSAAIPQVGAHAERLVPIPGAVPPPTHLPSGCAFRLRCPRASAACLERPALRRTEEGRSVACHHPGPNA